MDRRRRGQRSGPTTSPPSRSGPTSPPLVVATLNCRSLQDQDKMDALLAGCEARGIEVLLAQETWLNDTHTVRVPESWCHVSLPRPAGQSAGRGLSIFIRRASLQVRGWRCTEVASSNGRRHDLLAARVGPWLMASVYVRQQPDYVGLVQDIAGLRRGPQDNVLAGGDFNGQGNHEKLNDQMESVLGLCPLVRPPLVTRLDPNNLLDNVYFPADTGIVLDKLEPFSEVWRGDHYLVVAKVMPPGQELRPPEPRAHTDGATARPTRCIRWAQLSRLEQLMRGKADEERTQQAEARMKRLREKVGDLCCTDLHEANRAFLRICEEELGTYRPRVGCRRPYLTHTIAREALRQRQKARKAFNRAVRRGRKAPEREAPRAQQQLHEADRAWRAARDQAVAQTTEEFLSRVNEGDKDSFFRRFRSARGARGSAKAADVHLDPEAAAEFWAGVFARDEETDDVTTWPPYSDQEVLISPSQVMAAIKDMKMKCPGPDGLDWRFIRACKEEVAEVLAPCFTVAVNEGLPQALRRNKTSLLLKPDADPTSPASYRPITLLPMVVRILHKVLDQLFRPQLLGEGQGRQEPSIWRTQSAFMKKRGTLNPATLLHLVQAIHRECKGGTRKLLVGVFLDIRKAYDSMEYAHLLDILEQLHRFPRDWLEVLRKLLPGNETTIQGITVAMLRGLPQGGALCPLLCNAFMAELARDLDDHISRRMPKLARVWRTWRDNDKHCWSTDHLKDIWLRLLQYADDVALLARTPEEMQELLGVVAEWGRKRGLVFSDKSFAVLLSDPSTKEEPMPLPELRVGELPLQWHPRDQAFRYLGVTTQAARSATRLKAVTRVEMKEDKVRAALFALHRMFELKRQQHYVLPTVVRLGIEQVVHACALYDAPLCDIDFEQLDRLTMGTVRRILQVPPSTPTVFLRWELRLRPSELRAHHRAVRWARSLWHNSWVGQDILMKLHTGNTNRVQWDAPHPIFQLGPLARLTRILEQYQLNWTLVHKQPPDKKSWRKTEKEDLARFETAFKRWAIKAVEEREGMPEHHHRELGRHMGLDESDPNYSGSPDLPLYMYIGDDLPRAGIWARMPYLRFQERGEDIDRAPCAWCKRHDLEYGYHLMRCRHMPPRLLRRRDAVLADILKDVAKADPGEQPTSEDNLNRLFYLRWRGSGNWRHSHYPAPERTDKGRQPAKEVLIKALWYFRDMINTYRLSTAGTGLEGANPIWPLPVYGQDPYQDANPSSESDSQPLPPSPRPPRSQVATDPLATFGTLDADDSDGDGAEGFGLSPDTPSQL